MNVTLQLPDDLCTAAQRQAGSESKSLATWLAEVLRRELKKPAATPQTLVDRLGDNEFLDRDIPLPDRKQDEIRQVTFE